MGKCDSCPSKSNCESTSDSCGIEINPKNNIKNVIGIMSVKGGVGKSTTSVIIANELKNKGYKVGILDADITGPSIPRLMRVEDKKATMDEVGEIIPIEVGGIKLMSINFLIKEDEPVIWRGPILGRTVKQFWENTIWGDLDYLLLDLPPGTGDVTITVMQSLPINGIFMVTIPQDFISVIVKKGINMAEKMNIPVLGIIENMSYIICPNCGSEFSFYGEEKNVDLGKIDIISRIPMCKDIVNISKNGISDIENKEVKGIIDSTVQEILKRV